MKKPKETRPRFRVGDWVSVPYGTGRVKAQIVEDRGPIGARGRRLYDIRMDTATEENNFPFAVPEEYLEPAQAPDQATQA